MVEMTTFNFVGYSLAIIWLGACLGAIASALFGYFKRD